MASPDSKLSALQVRILLELAGMQPPWTLTGGAALSGFHLKHRTTRDLDLFWRDKVEMALVARDVQDRLQRVGLRVDVVQSAATFQRVNVSDPSGSCVVDLVAELVSAIEPPRSETLADRTFQIDTPHEILANKLCALVSRSELRDLMDVRALTESGGDLERALLDAPKKDSGFSPLTLAWTLKHLPVAALARGSAMNESEIEEWVGYQRALSERILDLSAQR
jgi:predicted nucleotidyltransferase component of viral defense system